MDQNEYLEQRVDDQINWYSKKSQQNQKIFKYLRIIEFVAAASIPFLAGYTKRLDYLQIITGLLGIIIAVIAGVLSLYRFQENWTEYRTTCETLKHEKYLFLTKVSPYDGTNAFTLFVEKIELLISKENSAWTTLMMPKKENNT